MTKKTIGIEAIALRLQSEVQFYKNEALLLQQMVIELNAELTEIKSKLPTESEPENGGIA